MLTYTDIVTYASASLPTDDVTVSGGAIDLGYVVPETSPGVFIPSEAAPTSSTVSWFYKLFKKNENATSSFAGITVFILNGIKLSVSAGVASIVSSSGSDSSGYVRLYGYYSGGTPGYEDIAVAGSVTVPGSLNWDVGSPIRAQRLSAGGAVLNSTGTITISKGATPLGIIPAGSSCATGEFELAVDAAFDSASTSTNRLTAPSGISFSLVTAEEDGLAMPSGGPLLAGSSIGIWYKMNRYANIPGPIDYVYPILRMKGYSA